MIKKIWNALPGIIILGLIAFGYILGHTGYVNLGTTLILIALAIVIGFAAGDEVRRRLKDFWTAFYKGGT